MSAADGLSVEHSFDVGERQSWQRTREVMWSSSWGFHHRSFVMGAAQSSLLRWFDLFAAVWTKPSCSCVDALGKLLWSLKDLLVWKGSDRVCGNWWQFWISRLTGGRNRESRSDGGEGEDGVGGSVGLFAWTQSCSWQGWVLRVPARALLGQLGRVHPLPHPLPKEPGDWGHVGSHLSKCPC